MNAIKKQIEAELERLDACDSETNASGICVYDDEELPRGWLRVSDGHAEVFGEAKEILAALTGVEYDRSATVDQDGEPYVCTNPACPGWHGDTPEAGGLNEHGHYDTETIQRDDGWELAWEALAFSDQAPRGSRDWPEDLIRFEQLEDGTCNDNPNTLVIVETNGGTRYAAGPHGVSFCALADWDGDLATTREEAIHAGCEYWSRRT